MAFPSLSPIDGYIISQLAIKQVASVTLLRIIVVVPMKNDLGKDRFENDDFYDE